MLASAAGAALLASCSADPDSRDSGGSSVTDQARARAARDSRTLLERYDAVLAAHPRLAGRLRPLRAQVAAHVRAFTDGTTPTATVTPTATPTPTAAKSSASAASAAAAPAVPAGEKAALADLAGAERALADWRAKDLLEVPGELARLLASVAAAGAAHAYLLTEGAK